MESVRAYWDRLEGKAKAGFHFLHVSTDEVYGSLEKDAPAFTETHRYEPNSPYSASKAASDHLVRASPPWNIARASGGLPRRGRLAVMYRCNSARKAGATAPKYWLRAIPDVRTQGKVF